MQTFETGDSFCTIFAAWNHYTLCYLEVSIKINIRLLYGILSIILALIIAFIAIPAVTRKAASTTEIIRIAETVYAGECITESDLETVTVGNFNLPPSLATKPEDVIGTYAVTNLYPGDYVLPQKVSSTPLSSDPSLDAIPDGMMAFSVSVRSLAVGLSDKLQVDDIVRVYHYDDNQVLDPVPDIPELHFVKVLAVTDENGYDTDYEQPEIVETDKPQTASVTLLVSPLQARLLTLFENDGNIHLALVSRGNPKLAEELLQRQTDTIASIIEESLPSEDQTDEVTEESSAASE